MNRPIVNYDRIHLLGIGGSGMSALAALLLDAGVSVSGSDIADSPILDRLRRRGANISIGHDAANLGEAEALVLSSAISPENPELREAQRLGIPRLHRSEALADFMRPFTGITVAGTHGKSTTAAMVTHVLIGAGLDPTVALGADLGSLGGNARFGQGKYFILEADESDRSFLRYRPSYAVVTSIDNDHLDAYGSLEAVIEAFRAHLHTLTAGGTVIACSDDANVLAAIRNVHHPVITYGCESNADFVAKDVCFEGLMASYSLHRNELSMGEVCLRTTGWHNVRNSLAAAALSFALGVEPTIIRRELETFPGVQRRLESKGESRGVRVVDDYGHHPTEIRAAVAACKLSGRRLVAVFQPHRYSRTQLLMDEWADSFQGVDELYLMDIYAAGEKILPGVSSAKLAQVIERVRPVRYEPSPRKLVEALCASTRPGDLLLTLGAGDVWKIGEWFLEATT